MRCARNPLGRWEYDHGRSHVENEGRQDVKDDDGLSRGYNWDLGRRRFGAGRALGSSRSLWRPRYRSRTPLGSVNTGESDPIELGDARTLRKGEIVPIVADASLNTVELRQRRYACRRPPRRSQTGRERQRRLAINVPTTPHQVPRQGRTGRLSSKLPRRTAKASAGRDTGADSVKTMREWPWARRALDETLRACITTVHALCVP